MKACSKQWVLRRRGNVSDNEQARKPDGSEFQTEGAATPKTREAKVVRTIYGPDRLVLGERR